MQEHDVDGNQTLNFSEFSKIILDKTPCEFHDPENGECKGKKIMSITSPVLI